MKKIFILFLLLFVFELRAAEDVVPYLSKSTSGTPKEDLVWNKWDTKNFIILSIDKDQGLYLLDRVEEIKRNIFFKWNLPNLDFETKCKLVCVPNQTLLSRLFNINKSHSEIRRESSGEPTVRAVWFEFDKQKELPFLISDICMDDDESCFIQRSLPFFEKDEEESKIKLSSLKEKFNSKDIFSLEKKSWLSASQPDRDSFDNNSFALCLFLIKEFGKDKFSVFLNSKRNEDSLRSIYGFKNYDHLDGVLKRYLQNLKEDLKNNQVPNEYLIVK